MTQNTLDPIPPADTDNLLTDVSMSSLELDKELLKGLSDQGFSHATPIQAETLPKALAGQDIAGQAHTGTGKTIAFLLAIMHRLLTQAPTNSEGIPAGASVPRALIVAPTRELADQIYKDARKLAAHTDFRTVVVYGGTGYDEQREAVAAGVD